MKPGTRSLEVVKADKMPSEEDSDCHAGSSPSSRASDPFLIPCFLAAAAIELTLYEP